MSKKYTVSAGIGSKVVIYSQSNWIILAIIKLIIIKIDNKEIYWKNLKIIK